MTSQISDADPSEVSDLLDVDGAPLLSLTDPSLLCLLFCCCCWRCVILLNEEKIFEQFGVFLRSPSWGLSEEESRWNEMFNTEEVPSSKSSTLTIAWPMC